MPLTKDEVKLKIKAMILKFYGADLDDETTLSQADLDSLDHVELAMEIEKEFDINIADELIEEFGEKKIDQLVKLVVRD